MRILAFSDWRVQPLEMIKNLIEQEKPDVILYAGDDLDRFIGINNLFFLKTQNHFLKIEYPEIIPSSAKYKKILTKRFKKIIRDVNLQRNNFFEEVKIPIYYVNGNDDLLLKKYEKIYLQIDNGRFRIKDLNYLLYENSKGKITFESSQKIREKLEEYNIIAFMAKKSQIEDRIDIQSFKDGIYVELCPNFGKFTINNNNEDIIVYGSQCEFGLESKIIDPPKEYADIYLSHLPPLGKLDLSVRFGINHLGSKELLDAIEKYRPKFVICGHSHIWEGLSEKIGDTIILNISSQDRDPSYGNYVIIDSKDWSFQINTIKDFSPSSIRGMSTIRTYLKEKKRDIENEYMMNKCEKKKAKEKDNIKKQEEKINLLDDLIKKMSWWNLKNIRSIELIYELLKRVENEGINTKRVKNRIESFMWERPKIERKITFNSDNYIFVDVETGLAKGQIPGELWLIGIGYKEELKQFLYPQEKHKFLKYLRERNIKSLVSWTQYDMKVLRPILESENIKIKFLDACQRTANCLTWHTYQLHKLYNVLFPEKKDIELIPGRIAGLYADHLIISDESCPNCPKKESLIEKIKERNKIDILQMIEICKTLWNFDE